MLLSYNRLFNIAIGSRGCGKSFSGKRWCINDFIKNGEQFIYMRRTEEELKKVKDNFFADIIVANVFPDAKFKIEGNTYWINDKLAGFALALSTATKYKSNSFPGVNKVLFDEFLIDKSNHGGYLRGEVERVLNLYETIDRGRDVTRVLMLSNAMSVVNPYFQRWNVQIIPNAKFIKTGTEIIVELVYNQDYLEWKRNTRFGKMIENTEVGKQIIDNEFVSDNYNFVEKLSGHRIYKFTVKYRSVDIGVWYNTTNKLFYCSHATQKSVYSFAFTNADHSINTIMFKRAKANLFMKQLIEAYEYGLVRYETIQAKATMLEIFYYI